MRHGILLLALLCCIAVPARAAADLGEVAWRQALLDLGNGLRLLCIAAHPDDEDGATLAWHRYRHGVRTHVAIATRGEGGQNEIGPELGAELAAIRTREMEAAAAIEGAQLHWLDLPDFGYSKTMAETYAIWGETETLRRIVRLIRTVRPHVIITHHGRMKDHGHHQAMGDATLRAFDLAADPEAFPEAGAPWQAARLYIRAWGAQAPGAAAIPAGGLDPVRGKTYAEIAAEALEAHESQGMAFFIDRLLRTPVIHYDLVKSAADAYTGEAMDEAAGPLFAGIPGLRLERPVSLDAPRAAALPELVALAGRQGDIGVQAARAARIAAEVRVTATLSDPVLAPGQRADVLLSVQDFGAPDVDAVRISGPEGARASALSPVDGRAEAVLPLQLPDDARPTLPASAHLHDAASRARPRYRATLTTAHGDFALDVPLDFEVAPPLGVAFVDAPCLVRVQDLRPLRVDIRLTNYTPDAREAVLAVEAAAGWGVEPAVLTVPFTREDEQRVVSVAVTPPASVAEGDFPLTVNAAGAPVTRSFVRVVDLELPGGRTVGVVQSYDDTFVRTLDLLGIAHGRIDEVDYAPARLDRFDAIIVDIRAYSHRPDLVSNYGALLGYVERGGRLLVMYQKTFEWRPEFAPRPLKLSRDRVTREDAPVTVLVPDHPLFNTPNRIGDTDWNGWVQERGLYFPGEWDGAYTPLIETADPGEAIAPGGLLVAAHGEGVYLYTALSWYRQLRELHPGALRFFANMLAL